MNYLALVTDSEGGESSNEDVILPRKPDNVEDGKIELVEESVGAEDAEEEEDDDEEEEEEV